MEYHVPSSDPLTPIFEDEKLRVISIPLKHRIPTYGYLFREKHRLLNVRKEKVERYGIGVADLVRIKQGEDFISSEGSLIPNKKLTHPPYHPRSYAYISDTLFDPDLAGILKNVDLLFHEATFSNKDAKLAAQTKHSTSGQAATLAKMAGVKKLLIGHFSSRYRDHGVLEEEARTIFPHTDGVKDGDIYSLPLERVSTE